METGLISFCTNYCDNQGIMNFTGTGTLANEPKYAKFFTSANIPSQQWATKIVSGYMRETPNLLGFAAR